MQSELIMDKDAASLGAIPPGPWTPTFYIGSSKQTGYFASFKGNVGLIVRQIEIWDNGNNVIGIQLTYSDYSKSGVVGTANNNYHSFTFNPLEAITSMKMWGNGNGTRFGRLEFTTNQNRSFAAGKSNVGGQNTYYPPVGAGYMVGIDGKAGTEIDGLSFYFIQVVNSVSMTVDSYAGMPDNNVISGVVVASDTYTNGGTGKMTADFHPGVVRTVTNTWMNSTSNQYGVSVSVTASIFDIFKAETGFQWQQTETSSYELSNSEDVNLFSSSIKVEIPPGETVTASVVSETGNADVQYNATITVECVDDNGNPSTLTFRETGPFQGVAFTQGVYSES